MLAIALALAAVASVPAPPPLLAPYIRADGFSPGDYRWMRGDFDGASAEEKAQFAAVRAYNAACTAADTAHVRATFAAMGVATSALLPHGHGDPLCAAIVLALPQGDQGNDWSAFTVRLGRVRPLVETLLWTTALAQDVADESGRTLADRLRARIVTDQVLRNALSWSDGERKGVPALDPAELGIVRAMLWSAIARRDAANTAWLKTVVAASGWPTIAAVGATASDDAWLLVQHADDDPVFQYRMLKLMEPLAARRAVSAKNFGFLYDRVMLPLTGKQRYGTQFVCRSGRWEPFPIEDPVRVDALRRAAGMSTLEENRQRLAVSAGFCRL